MNTIKEKVRVSQIINKSEFICTLIPVNEISDVTSELNLIRKEFYDATHNCYAYILGDTQELSKASDDGEPSQTAGVVILNALIQNNLTNVLCVVTRYFGGIKLGAGGLVRAYSSSTSLAIKNAIISEIIKYKTIKLTTSYTYINLVLKELDEFKANIIRKDFYENIILTFLIEERLFEKFKNNIINITKNSCIIDIVQ